MTDKQFDKLISDLNYMWVLLAIIAFELLGILFSGR